MGISTWSTFLGTALLCTSAYAAQDPLNPSEIGDFQKRQFIEPSQAQNIGPNLAEILGSIAVKNTADNTLEITSCQVIDGNFSGNAIADLKDPVFTAVIDKSWGLNVSLLFLNLGATGDNKIDVTGTDVADAVLPRQNIATGPEITKSAHDCGLSGTLYYVRSATLSLIVKKIYTKADADGSFFSFLKINGASYTEQGTSNTYAVTVFATPIISQGGTLNVVSTNGELTQANAQSGAKALGVDGTKQFSASLTTSFAPAKLSPNAASKLRAAAVRIQPD